MKSRYSRGYPNATTKCVANRKARFPQKKKQKTLKCPCSKMEAIVYRKLRIEKSIKIVAKSSLTEEKQAFIPSSPPAFVGMKIVRQLYLRFFPSTS